ncbi:MAG: hypothetical protein RMM98_11315 [Acidobacteriota bacterium]|nr:hypothetical protein [Blastocatellia bacterium]MDW8240196.1 hypothetical protein [Acidobacteriota bacterium]
MNRAICGSGDRAPEGRQTCNVWMGVISKYYRAFNSATSFPRRRVHAVHSLVMNAHISARLQRATIV